MYLELLEDVRAVLKKAVDEAGYPSEELYLGESQHADVSSSLPFRLGKELKKNPRDIALEIVSKITGISSQTVLHYQETGLIRPSDYDDETVRTLRRIEHLHSSLGVNEPGLRLILKLMEEVDRLQNDLRAKR
jgi:hypothetical protein